GIRLTAETGQLDEDPASPAQFARLTQQAARSRFGLGITPVLDLEHDQLLRGSDVERVQPCLQVRDALAAGTTQGRQVEVLILAVERLPELLLELAERLESAVVATRVVPRARDLGRHVERARN